MARNNFNFGLAGSDIDLQGATIHNYDREWQGDDTMTGPVPGVSVAYGRGDIVFYNNSLWLCVVAAGMTADNVPPGSNASVWEEITTGGGTSILPWSNSPGIYQQNDLVLQVTGTTQVLLYAWEDSTPSTPDDTPGGTTANSARWILVGAPPTSETTRGGTGVLVDHAGGVNTISLNPTVDQDQTFARDVNILGNNNATGNVTSGNTVSSPIATHGQLNIVTGGEINATGATTNLGPTTIGVEGVQIAGPTTVQRAIEGHEPVTLDQLDERESEIINRARAEFELEPEIDPGHEFRYYRTYENTGTNAPGADITQIPVTLPIGTIVTNDENTGEVEIEYPTTGRGAGSRSSTGRRLSGTLYTSPGQVAVGAGGVDIPHNGSEAGDQRLIGTVYAGYRPFNTPQIEQHLWRHNEMWAVADFEITLNYRLSADAPDSTPRTLTQSWSDIRMNFECWNHNILYHHKSIPGNLNGGDDAITAGPLLNYFAGAIGLQRTVSGVTETAMPPGMDTYMNRGRDGNLFSQTYDGGYIPGSYISIAPNITTNASGNDDAILDRLRVNQEARNLEEFGSNLNDQGNQDMRPLIFTAIPCPWRIISDTITHNYIQGNSPTRQFPAADVSEITDSGTFTFTRAEHRGFPGEGDDRHMEPHQTITTAEGHEVQAPVIPEVYIEVGTAFGQIVDMELQFRMNNVRYVNSIHQDNMTRTASVTVASMLPRGAGNNVIAGVRGGIWGTGQANTGGVGGGRENTALPPAIFKFLTSPGNSGSPITNEPFAVRTGSGIDIFDYGFLYGGNQSADPTRYFTPEENIRPIPVGGGTGQGYTAVWDYNAYDLAAGSFGATLQSNDGVQDAQGRHLLMRPHFSRPNLYNQGSGEAQLFTNAVKNGRLAPIWDSARAASADNNYQMGDVVRSTGLIPRFGTLDSTVGEDTTRLQLWVARRNPRISGGTVAPEDNQGPAHSFQASKLGDPLWYPLGIHRQLASDYVPLQEDGQRPLDMLHQEFTPGNYTRGRPPTFPDDFEDYEITGLPVTFSNRAATTFGQTVVTGSWDLRYDATRGDETNIPAGMPRAGELGRFNPEVFHFRKPSTGDEITRDFTLPRGGTVNSNQTSAYVISRARGGVAVPPPSGYIDPFDNVVLTELVIRNTSTSTGPNTRYLGHASRVEQTQITDHNRENGILHALPANNVVPTGTLNRGTSNTQELYMPNLAVSSSEDAMGNITYDWRSDIAMAARPRDFRVTDTDTILPAFGWQDHSDFLQIDFRGADNDDPPMNTRFTILEWRPQDGFFRISRVADGSDTSTAMEEPQWSDTDAPFRNIDRYVLGRRAGVDFLQAGSDVDSRIAGSVSVIGQDGIEISTNTTSEELIIGVAASALQAGPPNDILTDVNDTGNPLPFGMFGLIDLFLGQQFSNQEDGTEQPMDRTTRDFDFFERYRRRGTSYYWYPNRRAVVRADGIPDFLAFDASGSDLALKAPAVFQDVARIATTPIPRSVDVPRPDRGVFDNENSLRLIWGGTVNGQPQTAAPAVVPGRYYIMYGRTNAGLEVQWFFTSRAVTRVQGQTWFVSRDENLLAFGPGNAWDEGTQNLNQTAMDEIQILSIPEDDYRLFVGLWQNYVGRNDPNTATGQWRALLEG